MPTYRRWFLPGGTYFFTLVAHGRRPIFRDAAARRHLREALAAVRSRWPFAIVAIVLLPEHLHTVWGLPPGDARYALRWKRVKELFTRGHLESGGSEGRRSESRIEHGERGVWQRRFWEHAVRDEADLKRCVDYIHWNPKKHGHVGRVRDWPWSSFHRYVRLGEYAADWGGEQPPAHGSEDAWGE